MITHQNLKVLDLNMDQPLESTKIVKFENEYGKLPNDLRELYDITNGIEEDTWRIFPIFDENNPKKTWDSIQRANNLTTSKFSLDETLLKRFLVFGEIGGNHCAMYNKDDQSIWFEDDEGYHKTDLSLIEFIQGLTQSK